MATTPWGSSKSLTNDLLFKETFGHPNNKEYLIYFLAAFTPFSEKYLEEVEMRVIYESMLLKTKVTDKSLRGDILVEFGRFKVNLECYNIFDQNSYNKSLNYVLRIFSTIIERGQKNYNNNERILGINLIANIVSKNTFLGDAICSKVVLEHKEKNNTHELPNVGIYFYRLDKIDAYSKNDKRKKWLEFIRAKDYEERAIIAKGDEKMEALNEWVEEYINDERTKKLFGEWNRYIDTEKMKRINIGIGMEKGLAKGKKIGLAEGEQKIELNRIRSVRTMKDMNMSDKSIAKILNIPIDDVDKYYKKFQKGAK